MCGSRPLYLVLTAVLFAGVAGETAAGPNHRAVPRNAFSLMAGAHRFHRGENVSNHFLLRAGYGRLLASRYGLETHMTVALNAQDEQPFPGQGAAVGVDAVLAGVDFVLNLRPYRSGVRFVPFLSTGAEGLFDAASSTHGDRAFFLGAGVGATYILSPSLAVKAMLRLAGASYHTDAELPGPDDGDTLRIDALTAGVSVLF